MKREIKFRALKDDMSNCKLVYGDLRYNSLGDPIICVLDIDTDETIFHGCIKRTEGQFTGLKDAKGKDIYEGDLLGELVEIDGEEVMTAIPVIWADEHSAFMVDLSFTKERSCLELLSQNIDNSEVIGNVYENPELL